MERVLTLRELNRALLARQLLLERKRLSPTAVIERLVGMQAQWPPAPYVGIWTRTTTFKRETLERALLSGEVVKPTVMRGTLHLVTARDYPVFYAAFRDMRSWHGETHLAHALKELDAVRALAPLTSKEGLAHLERAGHSVERDRVRIFYALRRHAHLLHTPESALWNGRPLGVFAAYPAPDPVDELAARTELVRRYLAAFGPATRADIADWSGLRVADFTPALDALEPLRRFRNEAGKELLDVPRAPLPPANTAAPVRFLPKWDNVLLGHADRTRIIAAEHRKSIIGKNGDVAPTFLVDGFVAGLWYFEKGRVEIEPFGRVPKTVAAEAKRLEAWLA